MDEIFKTFDGYAEKKNWAGAFYDFNIFKFDRALRERGEEFWIREGERRAMRLFHRAAERVPAYKDFLKKNKVDAEKICGIKDFRLVPPTDKKNYVQEYSLENRLWDGRLDLSKLTAVSSGTSGEPTLWARGGYQEFESAIIHELLYVRLFEIRKHRTLLVIGFPMGVYVSGVATLLPSLSIAGKGYALNVVSVGNNKTELLRMLQALKDGYDQVIIAGHPFFIKDMIETGRDEGVSWNAIRLRFMFCSEGFNEVWRRYVAEKTGIAAGERSIISVYGSSEFLLMAHETPCSITIREKAEREVSLRRELFGEDSLPQVFQYNPFFRYVEEENGELLFTAASGAPLLRFNLHDAGRIISFQNMRRATCLKNIFGKKTAWQLPFLTLSGRSDQAIIFYAANIYPDHLKPVFQERDLLGVCTGKFVMEKGRLKNMDEFLIVNVELRKGVRATPAFSRTIEKKIVARLEKVNMEYLFLRNNLDKDIKPRVTLRAYQHEKYFKPGLKPRYIVKDG